MTVIVSASADMNTVRLWKYQRLFFKAYTTISKQKQCISSQGCIWGQHIRGWGRTTSRQCQISTRPSQVQYISRCCQNLL